MSDPPDINQGDTPAWRVLDRYRELELQLAILGHHLSAKVGLRPVDLQCFNLVHRHGSVSVGELARMLALPPATVTGIVSRLVDQGWVQRLRTPADRRAVVVEPLPTHLPQLFGLLAPLGDQLSASLEQFDEQTLADIARFLEAAAQATRDTIE